MNDFDCAGKTMQHACKTLRVWTKNEENFENFQGNFEIFWSKSLWKIDFFSHFLLNISLISDSSPKYIPLEDNTRFLQQFFRFRAGGERSKCSYILATPMVFVNQASTSRLHFFRAKSSFPGFNNFSVTVYLWKLLIRDCSLDLEWASNIDTAKEGDQKLSNYFLSVGEMKGKYF